MTGSKRREELINTIKSSTSPISGKTLAQLYDVSRQVIVQDIALLRTAGYDIISTNRGYILNDDTRVKRSESRCKLACKRIFDLLTRQKHE